VAHQHDLVQVAGNWCGRAAGDHDQGRRERAGPVRVSAGQGGCRWSRRDLNPQPPPCKDRAGCRLVSAMAADLGVLSAGDWPSRRLPAGLAVPMAVQPGPRHYEDGNSTNDDTCAGRTTVKWRRSRVATSATPSRSATATTEASTAPNGRFAYRRTRSAIRCTSAGVTATSSSSPRAIASRNAASASVPPLALQQPAHLGQCRPRHEQPALVGLQRAHAALMVSIIGVEGRHQRPRIDHYHAASPSSARIMSSERAARSPLPVRSAPANDSVRTRPSASTPAMGASMWLTGAATKCCTTPRTASACSGVRRSTSSCRSAYVVATPTW
jgi:hypothetical protein